MFFQQQGIEAHEEGLYWWLNLAVFIAALLTIPALILTFSDVPPALQTTGEVLNYLIYGVFLTEAIILVNMVGSFRTYIRCNKLDVAVLILTLPIFPHPLKALWILRVLRLMDVVPALFGKRFKITFAYYALVLIFFGLWGGGMAYHFYEDVSIFNSIYWASTTMTGVGYGDITPETTTGKLVAMVLQWSGAVVLLLGLGQVDEWIRQQRQKAGELNEEVQR